MYHLFAVKMVGYKKKQKKEPLQALSRLPPTATASLPTAEDGKEATWQPPVLPGS